MHWSLFQSGGPTTRPKPVELFRKVLSRSSAISEMSITQDGRYIATVGMHDRLVKLWHRQFVEGDSLAFTYLSHPRAVKSLSWRSTSTSQHTLLTVCDDGTARIWAENERPQAPRLSDDTERRLRPKFTLLHSVELEDGVTIDWLASSLPHSAEYSAERLGVDLSAPFRSRAVDTRSAHTASSQNACDWIVGIDRHGAVMLWAVSCLDSPTILQSALTLRSQRSIIRLSYVF